MYIVHFLEFSDESPSTGAEVSPELGFLLFSILYADFVFLWRYIVYLYMQIHIYLYIQMHIEGFSAT